MQDILNKLKEFKGKMDELQKWERSGSMSMVNREAHYQALASVKDHIIQFVTKLVSDMKDDEVKDVMLVGRKICIRKLMQDMYSGSITFDNKIIHQFDRITIPQLAGQLQSLLELYDPDKISDTRDPNVILIEKLKPFAENMEGGMVSQLISILGTKTQAETEEVVDPNREINELIAEANSVVEEVKMNSGSPDPREQIEKLKQKVKEMLHRVESIVERFAPTSQNNDMLHDTLHDIERKHDLLVDRVQQELNILDDKVSELNNKLKNSRDAGKTITIKID